MLRERSSGAQTAGGARRAPPALSLAALLLVSAVLMACFAVLLAWRLQQQAA